MYNVIFLSTPLSKVGRLKKLLVAVSQEKQLRPAARLQPPLLLHPTTLCHHLCLPQGQLLLWQSGNIDFTVPKLLCSPIAT